MHWSESVDGRAERDRRLARLSLYGRRAATFGRRAQARYDASVEAWVVLADRFYVDGGRVGRVLSRAAFESPLVAPESKALMRLTLGLLVAVLAWILVSCASAPQSQRPRREINGARPGRVEKKHDSLYLKRETVKIKPKDEGSSTGSIWADTDGPRQLIADERPRRTGDVVTVNIPEELQFVPPSADGTAGAGGATGGAGAAGGKNAAGHAKGAAGAKDNASAAGGGAKGNAPGGAKAVAAGAPQGEAGGDSPVFSDPHRTGILGALDPAPVTSLKMQLVALEPGGDAYLRGTKRYQNGLGEKRDVTVFAKVPARRLTSFELDARDLSEVALTEQSNGQSAEYAATGWDTVVSRKLAGFAPDIDAELRALEDVRDELVVAQDAVKDQMKAMAEERERVQKDRKRNFDETERLKTALMATRDGSGAKAPDDAAKPDAKAAGAAAAEGNPAAAARAGAGAAADGAMDKAQGAAQGGNK